MLEPTQSVESEVRYGARPGAQDPRLGPELAEPSKRRTFTAAYKLRILGEAAVATKSGEIASLLRREGLYTSHLTSWRKQQDAGAPAGLEPRTRGPAGPSSEQVQVRALEAMAWAVLLSDLSRYAGVEAPRRPLVVWVLRSSCLGYGQHDLPRKRTPLTVWFAAGWMMVSQKHGISARGLKRTLSIGSEQTAWAMLHRARALARPASIRASFSLQPATGDSDNPCASQLRKSGLPSSLVAAVLV